jgi:hypothetical protein
MFWNIRMDLYNIFFRFKHLMIFCFSHYLWARILRHWRIILENWNIILSRMGSYTKTSLNFVKYIIIREIWSYLWPLFSSKLILIS